MWRKADTGSRDQKSRPRKWTGEKNENTCKCNVFERVRTWKCHCDDPALTIKIVLFVVFETPNMTLLVFIAAARPRRLGKSRFETDVWKTPHVLRDTRSLPQRPAVNDRVGKTATKTVWTRDATGAVNVLIFFFSPCFFFGFRHEIFDVVPLNYTCIVFCVTRMTDAKFFRLVTQRCRRRYVFRTHSAAEKSHFGRAPGVRRLFRNRINVRACAWKHDILPRVMDGKTELG